MDSWGKLQRIVALVGCGVLLTTASSGSAQPPARDTGVEPAVSQPVDDPYYPAHGEPYFDALKYSLDLDWRPAARQLHGTADIRFRVTTDRTRIQLDLGQPLRVTTVQVDRTARVWTHQDNHLVVFTGKLPANTRHTLLVNYVGSPHQVPAPVSRGDIPGLGWDTLGDGSVWTMQEPWGALTWYPVNDHPSDKAYYTAQITSHGGMNNVFNGRRDSTRTTNGVTTTRWTLDQPAASYLITIAIGHFQRTVATGPHGLPLTYWIPRGYDARYLNLLNRTPEFLTFLESRLGPYPFARAGAVVVPADSAMETQTMITLGRSIWQISWPAGDVVHEYAHQWLGDTVTTDNWPDLWLNEGLTMYVQDLWEAGHGDATIQDYMDYYASIDNQLRSAYGPPGAYDKRQFASANVYYSGALMLHRIRLAVGDEKFFPTLRAWVQTHRNQSVDRVEFADFWSDHTGLDLHAFVAGWLTAQKTPAGP